MDKKKNLIWITLGIAFLIFSSASFCHIMRAKVPIAMQTKGFPSLGNPKASLQIVLVEDFQCKNCRIFSKKVIPKIQSHYIRPGKAFFTLVPVSFLTGSQKIANAALEVYMQSPKQFFPYLKDILEHEGEIKTSDLTRLAQRMGGIDIPKLEACIEKRCHQEELEKNLTWAMGVMGSQFRTPALFINGTPASTQSFEAIQKQINQILGKS